MTRVAIGGKFSEIDESAKATLLGYYQAGLIYDIVLVTTDEGEARVIGLKETYGSALENVEIVVCPGAIKKITIFG